MSEAPGDSGSLRGKLLVSSPIMLDTTFYRTVVLVLDHGSGGAIGVVLNRPSIMAIGEPLPAWGSWGIEPDVVFHGGPVEVDSVICLGRAGSPPPGGEGWAPLFGDVGTVDLHCDPTEVGVVGIRVFSGYASWAPGQLDGELLLGGWVVAEAEGHEVWSDEPEDLWDEVLAVQDGLIPLLRSCPRSLDRN